MLREYQEEIQQLRTLLETQKAHVPPSRRHSILDLEEEKAKIRQEYEAELQKLRQSYESEQQSCQRLQADVQTLKHHYEKNLERVDTEMEPDLQAANGENKLSLEQQETLARYETF